MAHEFTLEHIAARVEKIIHTQIGSTAPLSLTTNLQEDLDMDSLELVELGISLENEFDVSLPDAQVRRCSTIGDIVQLVNLAEQEPEAKSA